MARRQKSSLTQHILPTSATMIGACLMIISVLRASGAHADTLMDEVLALDTLLFIAACVLSFLSLRRPGETRLERMADQVFLAGMVVMAVVSMVFVFSTL